MRVQEVSVVGNCLPVEAFAKTQLDAELFLGDSAVMYSKQ